MDLIYDIFSQEVISYLTNLIAMVVFTFVGLAAKAAIAYMKQKIGFDKLDAFNKQVHATVAFLEQFGVNLGLENGLIKKEYAVNTLKNYADNMGLGLTVEEISVFIEAAVFAYQSE